MSTKLKLLGVDVASIGEVHGQTPSAQTFTYSDDIEQVYKRLILSPDGEKILGAVLVGDASAYEQLLQIKRNDLPLPENPAVLMLPQWADDANSAAGTDVLPASAQVCSCYDVKKGDIEQAVVSGCRTMADIKAETQASTGCGGCAALTQQILNAALEAQGETVNHHLCEHFHYTRQELADIIRITRIKTFGELIEQHGNGLGCDICKPAVGSMLASFWNDYVLDDAHRELQDTNDIFLGNMQKTAPIRWCLVSRGAKSPLTNSWCWGRWRKTLTCTPKSPVASALTYLARNCMSCRRFGNA
ncbi:nitrite reductase [NAD(P)H] large subunit [Photobacterium aphoticum]|uniref:Nitrite reductase [NAD(P)H] large subunit n=1 Tax=Photobacterium aphoticum TaxID=754436 RepID=A0A090QNJ7_9GAMM|nr:nitrite reductase [NAD(P)H] large subunit [Photobacterium aphoticum]